MYLEPWQASSALARQRQSKFALELEKLASAKDWKLGVLVRAGSSDNTCL